MRLELESLTTIFLELGNWVNIFPFTTRSNMGNENYYPIKNHSRLPACILFISHALVCGHGHSSSLLTPECVTVGLPSLLLFCSCSFTLLCSTASARASSFSCCLSCTSLLTSGCCGVVLVGVPVDVALDVMGGDASTGFTRPTWGTTGRVGRTGVTPWKKEWGVWGDTRD